MPGDREVKDLFALRDALIELSEALQEWLLQQSTTEGALPVEDVKELLKSLGERKLKHIKGEEDKTD